MGVQAVQNIDESYNELPYERLAHPLTYPAHMSTVASLFGLKPPDFRKARVLELGCAGGGNIFPLALQYPDSYFFGIDLSPVQIDEANQQKQLMGLKNIDFATQDIMNFMPKGKEKFDYIICHGTFSWVPDTVREKIFNICNEWLSPRGLAVISYNALPGWNALRSLREMMMYHNAQFDQVKPLEQIKRASNLLVFLAENAVDNVNFRAVLDNEIRILDTVKSNAYFYHEHLEKENAAFYLHDVVNRARKHGLEYVGDATIPYMYVGNMNAGAAAEIGRMQDPVVQEQYMDFLANRRFRTTILCRNTQKPDRNLKKEQIMDFYLSLSSNVEGVKQDPQGGMTFRMNNNEFTINEPISCQMFREMIGNNQIPVQAKELVSRVQSKLNLPNPDPVRASLMQNGLELVLRGFLSAYSDFPHIVIAVSEKPVVYPLARAQSTIPHNVQVTNALYKNIPCDGLSALIMQHMDGTRTLEDVADIIHDRLKNKTLELHRFGKPMVYGPETRAECSEIVKEIMPLLARAGLLVA